jgi:flavin-dependent dehydrogenase
MGFLDQRPPQPEARTHQATEVVSAPQGHPLLPDPTPLAPTLSLQAAQRPWEAIVVGAGPAGSLTAALLARRGLAVLLVEQANLPRGKVCGCCLNGRALGTLTAAGLGDLPAAVGAVPLTRLRLAAAGRRAEVALVGVALSREALDLALARAAVQAGAHFLPRTRAALGGLVHGARTLLLHQGEATLETRAAVVVAADGLGGKLLARAGVAATPPEPGARLGAGVVLEQGPAFYEPGIVFMACGIGGYVGLVRLEDGRLDLAAALDAALVRSGVGGAACGVLQGAGFPVPAGLATAPWRGTVPLTRRARRLAALDRVFLVGDAAGYVEPFTGEGMAWALAGGAALAPLAARAARAWDPTLEAQWAARYRRVVSHRQGVCRAVAAVLRRPWLTRLAVGLLRLVPSLAVPVVRRLNRPCG